MDAPPAFSTNVFVLDHAAQTVQLLFCFKCVGLRGIQPSQNANVDDILLLGNETIFRDLNRVFLFLQTTLIFCFVCI